MTIRSRFSAFVVFVVVFFLNAGVVSWSQTTQQFTGHVTDSTGALMPRAQVIVHNQAMGVDTTTLTTSAGIYTVSSLIPGTYDITVSKQGFKTEVKANILLNVDQTSTMDFTLSVGAQTEIITVNASAPQIETTKSDFGEILEGERVAEMPVDSGNVFNLFTLAPGTHDFSNSEYPRPYDNVTGNQYANGSPQQSQLNIDGLSNEASDVGRYAFIPSVDAIQEVKIVTNPYDASYGHAGGSSLDIQLKSGSNQFHGALDYHMRRTWLDAYDFQTKYNATPGVTPQKAQLKRDEYNVEGSGPLVIPHVFNGKNKLFYTVDYEQLKEAAPNNAYNIYSDPNPAWLTGDFSTATFWDSTTQLLEPLLIYDPLTPLQSYVDPVDGKTKMARSQFPGNRIPINRIDPVCQKILSYFINLTPNNNPGAGYAPWSSNYENLQTENNLWRNGMIKVDWNRSDADRFSFRWGGQGRYQAVNSDVGWSNSLPVSDDAEGPAPKSETGTINWTHTFSPNLLATVGASIDTYDNTNHYGPTVSGNIWDQLGFSQSFWNQLAPQQLHKFPQVSFNGYAGYGNGSFGYSSNHHSFQLLPTLTWIHGAHSVRAGMDLNFSQSDNPGGGTTNSMSFNGGWTGHYGPGYGEGPGWTSGNSIADALLGYPNGGQVGNNVHLFWSQHYYAPWVQDDWKFTRKLTLNLGLRWDFLTPTTERHNTILGTFNPTVVNPVTSQIPSGTAALGWNTTIMGGLGYAGVNGQPRAQTEMNKLNLQPRLGFAYAIGDKMSIRGGVAENYENFWWGQNGSDGFSQWTGYNSSVDGGYTPYTYCANGSQGAGGVAACKGPGLANPYAVVNQPKGTALVNVVDLGNSIGTTDPHFKIPSIWEYSLWYEAAVSKHDTVSVGYVGNRSVNEGVTKNLNLGSPQWNALCDMERTPYYGIYGPTYGVHHYCDDTSTGQIANPFQGISDFSMSSSYYGSQTLSKYNFTRPYPAFQDITQYDHSYDGKHWYNSLQATASHQFTSSLTMHATYTHAVSMSSGGWVDELNRVKSRQLEGTNNVHHAISASAVSYLPFGKNRLLFSNARRWVDEIINGWEFSPLYTYYSGFTGSFGSNWENIQTGGPVTQNLAVTHKILPPDASHKNYRIRSISPCVGYRDSDNVSLIHPSPAAVAANCGLSDIQSVTTAGYAVGRNNESHYTAPGAYKFDAAVSKNFAIPDGSKVYLSDRTSLQLRADLLNVLNHPNWDSNGCCNVNTDPTSLDFGTTSKTGPNNNPRYLQLSARLSW